MDEKTQIEAAQRNPKAFAPLYEAHYEAIFRYVYRRVGDKEAAADIVADVFVAAVRHIHKFEYRGAPFVSWLYRIAQNELKYWYRKQKKERTVVLEQERLPALEEDMGMEPEENVDLKRLSEALAQLKPQDLELVQLRYLEQFSYEEIAEILSVSYGNARVKVHRAMQKLSRLMGVQH